MCDFHCDLPLSTCHSHLCCLISTIILTEIKYMSFALIVGGWWKCSFLSVMWVCVNDVYPLYAVINTLFYCGRCAVFPIVPPLISVLPPARKGGWCWGMNEVFFRSFWRFIFVYVEMPLRESFHGRRFLRSQSFEWSSPQACPRSWFDSSVQDASWALFRIDSRIFFKAVLCASM